MPRRRTTAPEPIAILIVYLDQIADAVAQRDPAAVAKLLRRRVSSHMPRDVRDELHGLVRAGGSGFRAPMRFLRYHHRIVRLAEGGESVPGPGSQIEIPLDQPPAARPAAGATDPAPAGEGAGRSARRDPQRPA